MVPVVWRSLSITASTGIGSSPMIISPHGVHRNPEGGKQRVAHHSGDEGVADALDALVGIQFQSNEIAGAGADRNTLDQGIFPPVCGGCG